MQEPSPAAEESAVEEDVIVADVGDDSVKDKASSESVVSDKDEERRAHGQAEQREEGQDESEEAEGEINEDGDEGSGDSKRIPSLMDLKVLPSQCRKRCNQLLESQSYRPAMKKARLPSCESQQQGIPSLLDMPAWEEAWEEEEEEEQAWTPPEGLLPRPQDRRQAEDTAGVEQQGDVPSLMDWVPPVASLLDWV